MLTFEQYFNMAMIKYPSLYASPSFEESKFRVCDQAFNVIGSGAIDTIALAEWNCKEVPHYLFDGSKELFWVTDPKNCRFTEINGRSYIIDGRPLGTMTKEEALKIEGVTEEHLTGCDNTVSRSKDPYPNFEKEYSLVWKEWKVCDSKFNHDTEEWEYFNHKSGVFADLPKDWVDAGIWFYESSLAYFLDPERVKGYHEYICSTSDISFYQKTISEMLESGKTYEQISKEYECEFRGDVLEFAIRRWQEKHTRILKFIVETIEHLRKMQRSV